MGPTSKWLFVPGLPMRVPKSPKLRLPQFWNPITLRADLESRCGLKKSYSPCRELSNGILHAIYKQVNRINSWLFLIRSQTSSLTPGPSFGHNLCFKCPNEQCEPILNIYVPRSFQWYKKCHKPLSFNPWNPSMKIWESIESVFPKLGVALGVWGFIPSHFPTLPGICDVTPKLSFGLHLCKPLCLGHKPKTKVATNIECKFRDETFNAFDDLLVGKHDGLSLVFIKSLAINDD